MTDKNNTVRIGVYTSELIDKLYYDYWQYCWQIANKNIQYVWPLKLSYRYFSPFQPYVNEFVLNFSSFW
jgi:hypothetical protein